MKLSEKEAKLIRTFVRGQFCDNPDLSTLSIRILKKRYLADVRGDTFSPEAKSFMKQVVREEIRKMQDKDTDGSGGEVEGKKRKRTIEPLSEEEDESMAKKSRQSESKDKADSITTDEEEETQSYCGSKDEKQVMNKTQRKDKRLESSEESTNEEQNDTETEGNGGDSPKKVEKNKLSTLKDKGTAGKSPSHGKETPQSDEDGDGDDTSSDGSDKEKSSEKKIKDDTDSDSSSLPSLEDENKKGRGQAIKQENNQIEGGKSQQTKKKGQQTKKSVKGVQNNLNKSIVRLKRFISLCGVRRNYKKLLQGCDSVRSQVAVLKKELEDLGVQGKPSVEVCKKIRIKREEAQELAELDVNNIIPTEGRPKRRVATAWQEQQEPPSLTYSRVLSSSSDGDEKNKINT